MKALGDKVDADVLLRSGGFPNNHDFFRVRHTKDQELYVVKRRRSALKEPCKRSENSDLIPRPYKAPRLRSPSPVVPETDDGAAPQSRIDCENNSTASHTTHEVSVADSLSNDDSSAAPARIAPAKRSCSTCIRLNKGKRMFRPYSRGRFMPGQDQCIICSVRKLQEDGGQASGAFVTSDSGGTNYEKPYARTVSPSPSEDGPVTHWY